MKKFIGSNRKLLEIYRKAWEEREAGEATDSGPFYTSLRVPETGKEEAMDYDVIKLHEKLDALSERVGALEQLIEDHQVELDDLRRRVEGLEA